MIGTTTRLTSRFDGFPYCLMSCHQNTKESNERNYFSIEEEKKKIGTEYRRRTALLSILSHIACNCHLISARLFTFSLCKPIDGVGSESKDLQTILAFFSFG